MTEKAKVQTKTLKIYCDGACSGNPGPGGWGAVLIFGAKLKTIHGSNKYTTNNQMEIRAAIEGLKAINTQDGIVIEIYTDSTYLKNGITQWIHSWKKSNWKNGKIKNIELWKELDSIAKLYTIKWNWVKGHSGDVYNEMADKIAKDAVNQQAFE